MRKKEIKSKIKKLCIIAISFFVLANIFVAPAFAAATLSSDFELVPCLSSKYPGDCNWAALILLVQNIMNFLIVISASLAVLAFCYAGFLYVTAFGEMGKIETAHSIFSKTIVGVVFVLLGWLIIATILKVLEADPNVINIIDFNKVETIQKK